MFLKSLEINGFKSFASKTILDFLPYKDNRYSITAIVGPNGSGKSNVSDAIRWVMGEQSMKSLRGKKSTDIIFAGTEHKGQMSAANVTLVLDNSDKRTLLDYEDLILTRKVYRSGESEYLINGSETRLLDVQMLLAKAQFGQGSYSVVGQGMIDKLILQTPEERKIFFDEAAGIKEFQIKRHHAYLKLVRSKEHIAEAELLLNEISPRLKTLSRQVKKLEERQSVEMELRELQEKYYATLWQRNKIELDEASGNLAEKDKIYHELSFELNKIQEELAVLAKEKTRQDVFENLQSLYQDIQREQNSLEREKAVLQGKMQTEYSKVGKQNIGWLTAKIEDLKIRENKLNDDITKEEILVATLNDDNSKYKKLLEQKQIERTELRGSLSNLQQRAMETKSEQTYWHFTGLKATQAILSDRQKFGGVYGAVAQLGEVKKDYLLALDVAAGGNLSSIVVNDDIVAEKCIRFLREQQLGVATFLPLNKIRPRIISHDIYELAKTNGVFGLATDLVKFDNKFSDVFSYVFGNTLVVDNIETARGIGVGRVRMVTLEGDLLETSGSMKGGFRKGKQQGLSFAHSFSYLGGDLADQEEKIAELQKRLEGSEIEFENLQEKLRLIQSEVSIAKNRLSMVNLQKQELGRELAALEQELALQNMTPEDYDEVMKKMVVDQNKIETKILEVNIRLEEIQKKIADFNAEEEKKKQRVFSLQDEMQVKQTELNKISEQKNVLQIEIAKIETKQEDLDSEAYQELQTSVSSITERIQVFLEAKDLEYAQQEIQKLKYKLSLIGGIDEETVKEYEETRLRHEGLSNELDDLNKAVADLEVLVAELDETMRKRRDKAFKQIKKEFTRYFKILFEGGEADLVEVYGEEKENVEQGTEFDEQLADSVEVSNENTLSDELAENEQKKKRGKKILIGIEIKACPPGKKIKNIQALSGGERTLTSISLLCAILRTNPSPFVVLDEVEAALDEANTLRFTSILRELAEQSQFIVITHNHATMHAADALYGVTMGADGISKLLSVKMEK